MKISWLIRWNFSESDKLFVAVPGLLYNYEGQLKKKMCQLYTKLENTYEMPWNTCVQFFMGLLETPDLCC